jgi:hypothetical protein
MIPDKYQPVPYFIMFLSIVSLAIAAMWGFATVITIRICGTVAVISWFAACPLFYKDK